MSDREHTTRTIFTRAKRHTEVLVSMSMQPKLLQVADNILKPVHTVAEKCDSRRISPLSRCFRRQSHFSATLWTGL